MELVFKLKSLQSGSVSATGGTIPQEGQGDPFSRRTFQLIELNYTGRLLLKTVVFASAVNYFFLYVCHLGLGEWWASTAPESYIEAHSTPDTQLAGTQ